MDRSLAASTVPQLDQEAVGAVAGALDDVAAKGWPRRIPFPHVYVTSTLHRDSFHIVGDGFSLVVHDDGVVDSAVAAAEIINHYSRQSASYVVYSYIFDQLVANRRPDLATSMAAFLFPIDGQKHPLFAGPDTRALQDFMLKDSQLYLRPPSRAFRTIGVNSVDQFHTVAQRVFIFHELGHHIAAAAANEPVLLGRFNVNDVSEGDPEVTADTVAAALTLSALGRMWGFSAAGSMTWIFAQVFVLLKILHAFASIRDRLQALVEERQNDDVGASGLATRSAALEKLANDSETLIKLFRWAGSRARAVPETLAHFREYADIVAASMEHSADTILDVIRRNMTQFARAHRDARLTFERDLAACSQYDLVVLGRKALGSDVSRTVSVHSNQAPKVLGPPPRPLSLDNVLWRQPSPLRKSHGMRAERRPSGVLLDVSDWCIEPV